MLFIAALRFLYSVMWLVGSETECLRLNLSRGPNVSCQLPGVYQKSLRVLAHQTCHTSARLEGEEVRHSHPLDMRSGICPQRDRTGNRQIIVIFSSPLLFSYWNHDHYFVLWSHNSLVNTAKRDWIQSEATLIFSTTDKSKPKQQLGSEVPTHQWLVLDSGERSHAF